MYEAYILSLRAENYHTEKLIWKYLTLHIYIYASNHGIKGNKLRYIERNITVITVSYRRGSFHKFCCEALSRVSSRASLKLY